MPIARFQMPDGRIGRFEVPDGTSEEQAQALIAQHVGGQGAQQPAAPAGTPMARMEKYGQGLVDPINAGAQWLTRALPDSVVQAGNRANNWLADKTGLVGRLPEGGVDQQVREGEAAYQAKRQAAGESGFDGYRLLGNVLNPANAGIASSLPRVATTASRIGAGALGGAAMGGLSPVTEDGDFASQKAKQIGIGAAFGGLLPALTAGAGRVISPNASRNPDLALLRGEGVNPTVGQSLGGRWNAAEEKLQSVPILGDMIAGARGRALGEFNSAAINRATAPIGAKVTGAGQKAVAEAGDAISAAYDAGKSAMGHFRIDPQGAKDLMTLSTLAKGLPEREAKAFNDVVGYLRQEVSNNGSITGEGFKRIDSLLGRKAAEFSGSPDAYQKQVGTAFAELQRIITENAKRANPKAAEMLGKADEAYANLVRIEGASKGAMNSGGVFTPGQLNTAVRGADRSVRDRATARGEALLQDLGGAGQSVLGNKVPNSFTADRALMALGAGGGAAMLEPTIAAGVLSGSALYSRPLQTALSRAVSSRPQSAEAIAEALRKSSPLLGSSGGLLGLDLLN